MQDNPRDRRAAVIESRIADRPAAVWFADYTPATITSRVRAVTSGGAAQGRVPVVVAYAIPDRDCGGASQGGAPDLGAYDAWIDGFAAGLGSGEVVVVLEPDSIAQSECLSAAQTGRPLRLAGPRGPRPEGREPRGTRLLRRRSLRLERPAAEQAALLKQAGAASAASSDGIFSNVSNFHTTADEIAYDRQVLDALGRTARPGRRHRHQPQRQRRPARRRVVRPGRPEDRPGTDPEHRRAEDRRLPVGEAAGGVGRLQGHTGHVQPVVRL